MLRRFQMPKERLGSDMWGHWERPLFRPDGWPQVPTDPRLLALYCYWGDAAGPGELQQRTDVFPVRLTSVLPHVYVLDVVGATFRFRLRGSEIDRRLGHHRTGLTFEECGYGDSLDKVKREYANVVRQRRPVTTAGMVYWGSEFNALRYENIRLPVFDAAGAVVHLLCAMVFHEEPST
ncbi:PAS domain-containing protein [Marinibaculum pumilum]|uniref:PAS domain-containing protein n=1 Tax=Marinibaculum pumilum TaxID=1766165 RepID=A0ABV7L6I0_9PROT